MGNRRIFRSCEKFSKTYLKLDHIKQTNEIDIHKNIEYELFISIYIKFVYYLYNLFSFKEKKNRIVNKSLIVDAIFNTDFLLNIIYNKDIDKAVEIFEEYFIKLTHTQKGKSYEIKCIALARILYLNPIENIIKMLSQQT